jgi:hypothetical protein
MSSFFPRSPIHRPTLLVVSVEIDLPIANAEFRPLFRMAEPFLGTFFASSRFRQ